MVLDILKAEMPENTLPSMHRTYKNMHDVWNIISMACKLDDTMPQQLKNVTSGELIAKRIFDLLVQSLIPSRMVGSGRKKLAALQVCREWDQRFERAAPVLALVMIRNPKETR